MQFQSEEEVEEVLMVAKDQDINSPFTVLERWMEHLGPPPCPSWVRVKGIPLHVWHEEVFRLIGNCLGRTVEIDERIRSMEGDLQRGRIKVLLNKNVSIHCTMPI